jgi:hypothetical protein
MRVLLSRAVLTVILCCTLPAWAEEYYVAPDGNDADSGSEDEPFATVQQAQQAANPGDTVYFRGGVYEFSGNSDIGVLFDKSGSDGARINYWAYPGETPVFDFNHLTPQARIRGFSVRANWLHFRGLELTGVQQILVDQNESWCIRVEDGSNNIFEQLNLHHNEGPGLFIVDGGNNLVLNVDSHHNYDPDRGGENADGFGCHTNDAGNVFRGCRSWFNSDDGFDFINSPGVCTVEYSWAFRNGFVPDTNTAAGNGAGIKAGGFTTSTLPATIPRHVVRFNVSFGNRAQGFYANHHEGGIDWISNTAFNNPRNFDLLADEGRAEHYLRNNLAAGTGDALARATANEIDDSFNSWSLGVGVSNADFVSTSDSGMDGPRQADGSLPDVGFLHLAQGSDLIDAGTDVGLPFAGAAPDLGAFELGLEPVATGEPDAQEPASGGANGVGGAGTEAPDEPGAGGAAPETPDDTDPMEMPLPMAPDAGDPHDDSVDAPDTDDSATPPNDDGASTDTGDNSPDPQSDLPAETAPPTAATTGEGGTSNAGLSSSPVATESPAATAASADSGCGCRTGGRGPQRAPLGISLLLLGCFIARRRRTSLPAQ